MKRNTKWILQLLMLEICLTKMTLSSDWAFGGFPMRSEMACDKYPISLRCPGHDVIQIVSAQYGRQNTFTCSASTGEMKNTKCSLPAAKEIMAERCNNKTTCSFPVSDAYFPDPCPGTHKYLETSFNCVKFMFGCPGQLTGIGAETLTSIEIQPQPGSWTKDPLSSPDHVFFIPSSQQLLQEYRNWEDFMRGNPLKRYNLPSKVAPGNIIVYDRNLYYVKADSQSIIRYSLITQRRTKEAKLPVKSGNTQHISLSVDENGLWVIYPRDKNLITISKFNKDQLTLSETWNTNRRATESLHAFIICGVLYSVSPSSGRIDYFYNTNLKQEKRGNINFDQSFGYRDFSRSSKTRSFRKYNATSISYNPREQLLYLWDSNNANAVVYKLHFDGRNPDGKGDVVKTTKSTTTYTTRRITTPKRKPTTTTTKVVKPTLNTNLPVQPLPSVGEPDDFFPVIDFCFPVTRSNINWPKTNLGETAVIPCSDGTKGSATWKCIREPWMREADWHVAGPDLSKCITWVSDVEVRFDEGSIDRSYALSILASQVVEDGFVNEESIRSITDLMRKFLSDPTLKTRAEVESVIESVGTISSKLLNSPESLKNMEKEEKTEISNLLMNGIEKAAFLYADTVAMPPVDIRDTEPFVVSNNKMILQIEVRERTYEPMTSESVTSFPSEETCFEGMENCGNDVISIPDSEIMGQKGLGPATVVFALYENLGDFLDQANDDVTDDVKSWEIDSRIISATFRQQGFQTTLDKPAVIVLQHKKPSNSPHQCVYWDYSESTKSGNWSSTGCNLISSNSTHTTCECNHLTTFAVLVNHAGVTMTPFHDTALEIVTSVGISISIVCLILCILTFCYFRNLYNDRTTIHKHLCICLLIAETIFLFGINQTGNKIACSIIAGLLHYFFLAVFCWMALEGFQLYVMLVEVFEGNGSRWKWYYLVGYGIPALIVGISAGIDYTGYGTDTVCWLHVQSGFIWSFVGPILVIILLNLVFLSITVYKMYVHTMSFTDSGKINSIKASVRGASVLLCLLGITWAFGILWINEHMTVLAYLFCIFNAFQGMFIFIFHCLLPKKVREEYKRFFKNNSCCCKRMHGGTYNSDSMLFSKRYAPGSIQPNGLQRQNSQNGQSQLQRMWNETVAPNSSELSPINPNIVPDVAQNRDTGRLTMGTRRFSQTDTQIPRHEDEVFLPAEHGFETQRPHHNDVTVLHDEMQYDRLQHHHHGAQFNTSHCPHPRMYHTGLPHPSMHISGNNHTCTVSHHGRPSYHHMDLNTHFQTQRNFEPKAPESSFPNHYGTEHQISYYSPRHNDRGEGFVNPKRDSGISMHNLPQFQNDRNHIKSSHDNLIYDPNAPTIKSPRNRSQPIRNESVERECYSPNHVVAKRLSQPIREQENISPNQSCPLVSSDDERHTDPKSGTIGTKMSQNCSIHTPMLPPTPIGHQICPKRGPGGKRFRKSPSSESDDPIATDCSITSSTGSYTDNISSAQNKGRNDIENISAQTYYEEPICHHKRRLPDTPIALSAHKEQWRPAGSLVSDHSRDENDLEVEMLTSEKDAEKYHVPSGYQHHQLSPLSSVGQSDESAKSEFNETEKLISAPAGYRSGMVGNSTYSSVPFNIPGRNVPQMGYYGKTAFPNVTNGPNCSQNSQLYYPHREHSISEDLGARMITNL